MGFGLLILGYLSVFGTLPYFFLYYSWGIYIAAAGGLIMLAGLCRLSEYNLYFKASKYICIAYILILLGFSPFLLLKYDSGIFTAVSKIIRICVLFAFHFFLISGISALALEIENKLVLKKSKVVMYISYAFFSAFILEFFDIPIISHIMIIFTFGFYFMMFSLIYSCYMRITYEGHDEEIERISDEKAKKKKKG